mgnify:FL=1
MVFITSLPPLFMYSCFISSIVHPNYKRRLPTNLNVLISSISYSDSGHCFFIMRSAATYLGNNSSLDYDALGLTFSASVALFLEHVDAILNHNFLSIVLETLASFIQFNNDSYNDFIIIIYN